jgi:hypothetical protein
MDRFTWSFAAGAVLLCVVAVASAFCLRPAPPSLSTPAGGGSAYLQAVRDRDADRAWELLAPGAAVGPALAPPGSTTSARDAFRRQVSSTGQNSSDGGPSFRVITASQDAASARVDVEVTTGGTAPALFGGGYSRTLTFALKRPDGNWKIDTAPALYELGF